MVEATVTLLQPTFPKPRAAQRVMLTDVALRALAKTPPAQQTDIPDSTTPGLSARVTPKGIVTWSLRLRVAGEGGQSARGHRPKGQQYRLTLGTYPSMSIKAARAKASDYVRQAEAGLHPVRALERKAVGRHDTVERLVKAFIEDYAAPNLRAWKNARSVLNVHIVPKWGSFPVDQIEQRDAAKLLADIAKGEIDPKTDKRVPLPGAAAEARKWGSLLFSWAKRSGLAQSNPFADTKNPIRAKPRQRFLDMEEVRAVWKAAATLDQPWRELVQLLLLTACRLREVAHARWAWINETEQRLVVPAESYKTQRPFLVALPQKAIDVIGQIRRWNEGDYLFSTCGGVTPVWDVPPKVLNTLHTRAEKILGRNIEHYVVHDFRRTVRTHLSRLGVSEVVAELVLGHALRGVAATYNVYDFESEKRQALARWADELART